MIQKYGMTLENNRYDKYTLKVDFLEQMKKINSGQARTIFKTFEIPRYKKFRVNFLSLN
jgi:hypothetical protein